LVVIVWYGTPDPREEIGLQAGRGGGHPDGRTPTVADVGQALQVAKVEPVPGVDGQSRVSSSCAGGGLAESQNGQPASGIFKAKHHP